MCRLYAFRSSLESRVHQSLVAAENALARQSERHRDGWGLAFYNERYPHVIRSEKQALADGLFRDLSAVVSTRTLVAHIRQATMGNVSVLNCHPFQHGPWTFAHNGQVAGYRLDDGSREALLHLADPAFRRFVHGTTDTEVCFHIFLSELAKRSTDLYSDAVTPTQVTGALRATFDKITTRHPDRGEEQNRLTFVVTNGAMLLGVRYRRPLNFSTHKTRCPERDTCAAFVATQCEAEVRAGEVRHLIVTSEKIADNPNVWQPLDDGEFVAVDAGMVLNRGTL